MQEKEPRRFWTPEFTLVVVMLIVLVVLVWLVLTIPVTIPSGDQETRFTDILDYRQGILTIIVTAFGAWVGAGAAYFFGRENLREAASSLLAMREPTSRERLRQTLIREVPPRPLDWMVKPSDKLLGVNDKLTSEPSRWFIPIINDNGILETVIHEEAIWRFFEKESKAGTAYADIWEKPVSDAITYIKETEGLDRVEGIHVVATLDSSAGVVNEQMQTKGVYLTIVTDEKGKPTHYITTGDLRKVLLQDS